MSQQQGRHQWAQQSSRSLSTSQATSDNSKSDINTHDDSSRVVKLKEMTERTNALFPAVQQMTPTALSQAMHNSTNVVIVDVRMPEERHVSMIPGSIAEVEFRQRLEEFKEKKACVVGYCTIGFRSSQFAAKYDTDANLDVYNLSGSILGWIQEGYEIVDADQRPTTKIHAFGKKWAEMVPPGYDAQTFSSPYTSYALSLLFGRENGVFSRIFK